MNSRLQHPRGFIMLEMLTALVLLSVFALIAAPLFKETMGVIERAPANEDAIVRFESATEMLREDAWGARTLSADGSNGVSIEMPNKPPAHWQIDSIGDLVRWQGAEEQRWVGVGVNARLEVDGPSLVLRLKGKAAEDFGEVRCPSLVQLAGAGDKK